MYKFIKSFDSFVLEKKQEYNTSIPEEVLIETKEIITDNFDQAKKFKIDDDVVSFVVTQLDFEYLDPDMELKSEFSPGVAKKRKYDVNLTFIDSNEETNAVYYKINFLEKNTEVDKSRDDVNMEDDLDDHDKWYDEDEDDKADKKMKKRDILNLDFNFED